MDSQSVVALGRPYCGLRGVGAFECLAAAQRAGRLPEWSHFIGRSVQATHRARTALWRFIDLADLRPGDELLAPGYNCGSEIDPFVRKGISVRLYRVDGAGRIDLGHAAGLLSSRTRAMLVVHYFGWPHPLRDVVSFCTSHGLFLVEDCALSLFSESDEGPVGTMGDAAVFSFPKTLSVPDGGALSLRAGRWSLGSSLRSPGWPTLMRRLLPLWKARVLGVSANVRLHRAAQWITARFFGRRSEDPVETARPGMPDDYYFDLRLADLGVSRVTAGILPGVSPDKIRSARQHNYSRLAEWIEGVPGIRPFFSHLPSRACPLVMPLIVRDRRNWLTSLLVRGVPAIEWWAGFHRALPWDDVPEACDLKSRVIALPIHHEMRPEGVEYTARVVREVGTLLGAA